MREMIKCSFYPCTNPCTTAVYTILQYLFESLLIGFHQKILCTMMRKVFHVLVTLFIPTTYLHL